MFVDNGSLGDLSSMAMRKGSLKSLPKKTSSSRDQDVPLSAEFTSFKEAFKGAVYLRKQHRVECQGQQSVMGQCARQGIADPAFGFELDVLSNSIV